MCIYLFFNIVQDVYEQLKARRKQESPKKKNVDHDMQHELSATELGLNYLHCFKT